MNNKYYFLIVLCFLTSLAQAKIDFGGDISGGGYVIYCKSPASGEETIELLDFFEAKYTLRNFELADLENTQGADAFEKAKAIAKQRLEFWTPQLSAKLVQIIENFKAEDLAFIERGIIQEIDDANTSVGPETNCYKSQIAVQIKNPAPTQYRVLVDKRAWDKLNMTTKTGLILHEALYTLALEQGHLNSNKVRILNSIFSSKNSFDYSEISQYFKYAEIDGCMNFRVDFYNVSGLDQSYFFPVKISSFYNSHSGRYSGTVCENVKHVDFLGGSLSLVEGNEIVISTGVDTPDSYVDFIQKDLFSNKYYDDTRYYNGSLRFNSFRSFHISEATYVNESVVPLSKVVNLSYVENFQFDESGKIKHCDKAWGTFDFFGMSFELESFTPGLKPDTDSVTLKKDLKQIPLLGTTLNFYQSFDVTSGFVDLYYKGVTRTVQFMGNDVQISDTTKFHFSETGVLLSISSL